MVVRSSSYAPPQGLDLRAIGYSDAECARISELTSKDAPTVQDLELLALQNGTSGMMGDYEQRLVREVLDSLRGHQRPTGGVSISADGSVPVNRSPYLTTMSSTATGGEPSDVVKVREEIGNYLWGQTQATDAFIRVAKDAVSPARKSPPVMVISGDPGHGKDEALAGFTQVFLSEDAQVRTIDLTGMTDSDFGSLFDPDEGLLSMKVLKKSAKQRNLLVHLIDSNTTNGLEKRLPKIAAELKARLLAEPGAANFADIPYVFDFEQKGTPHSLMVNALGAEGNRVTSAFAEFQHLDAATMLRYFEVHLNEALSQAPYHNMSVEVDADAMAKLGEALATPDKPLYELRDRVLRMVLTHVDTQTNIDKDKDAVRLKLNPTLSEKQIDDIVQQLKKPNANLVDLGEKLFVASIVAKKVGSVESREQLIEILRNIPEPFSEAAENLLDQVNTGEQDFNDLCQEAKVLILDFALEAATLQTEIDKRLNHNLYQVILPSERESLMEKLSTIEEYVDSLGNPDWAIPILCSRENFDQILSDVKLRISTFRTVVDALAGETPTEETQEANS